MKRQGILFGCTLLLIVLLGSSVIFANEEEPSPVGESKVQAFATVMATPNTASVLVDEQEISFEAYNINGYNYFKLRDLAMVLNGTAKQFGLNYDGESDTITMLMEEAYTPDGQELTGSKDPQEKTAYAIHSTLFLGPQELDLVAYNIDGYNYFRLRDIGQKVNFFVGWDSDLWSISINSQSEYDYAADANPWTNPELPGGSDPNGERSAAEQDTYSLQWINEHSNYFINKVDGYRMMVPGDMQVDMSQSGKRAILEKDGLRIEIYNQPVGSASGISIATYKNYSNKFIQDTSVHTTIFNGNKTIGKYQAYVLEWFRNPLAKVQNDKNYYASVDLTIDSTSVITMLFKSDKPFDTGNGSKTYVDMVKTFALESKTAAPYIEKKHAVARTEWNQKTKDAYEKYFSENSELTWGIFQPSAPISYVVLKGYEQQIGYTFPINLFYTNLPNINDNLSLALSNAAANERILELTLQTAETSHGSGNMVYDVLNGDYDNILIQYAQTIASQGNPVLFRLGNEMNGDWCVYSAYHTSKDTEIYIAFYKYVYSIFKAQGATANTIWVWNPNEKSFPDFKWNDALCYYPGDEYVDVVGLTGYNTGTYYSGEKWRSFAQIYDSLYQEYVSIYQQPLMITEFSCSKFGGDKVAWVEQMFQKIDAYDRIKVAVWWDGCDWDAAGNVARSYFIDDVPGVMDLFLKYIGDENIAMQRGNGEGYVP